MRAILLSLLLLSFNTLAHDPTEFDLGGVTYWAHIPVASSDLVIDLHGGAGSGQTRWETQTDLLTVSHDNSFMIVFPDGYPNIIPSGTFAWNGGICCGRAETLDVDHVGFLDALITVLVESLSPSRIFMTGYSSGGQMVLRYVCEGGYQLDGAMPVSAVLALDGDCAGGENIPIYHLHGDNECNQLYFGGVTCGPTGEDFMGIPETIEKMIANRGECEMELVDSKYDGSWRTMRCTGGASYTFHLIPEKEHAWTLGIEPEMWDMLGK